MSQSEAQRRAEARRAKILARGSAGLAKLATTARGEEASVLYDNPIPSRTPTPAPPNDPAAAYHADVERTMAALAASEQRPRDPGDPIKAFEEMMRQMNGAAVPPAGGNISVDPTEDPPTPELPKATLPMLTDSSSPFGADMGSMFPPEMMQMFQSAGGDVPGASTFPAAPPTGTERPLIARLMPLLHVISIIALFTLTIVVWEPSVWASGASRGRGGGRADRWMGLRGDTGVASDVLTSGWASLPVFWTFITLEVLLYSTETLFTPATQPRLPAMVAQFLPLVPPQYSRPLLRVLKIVQVARGVVGDACLLVWLFGMAVIVKGWGA